MEAFLQDVRFGLRMLAKSPAFTIVAVLTLALGIGANAAIFSVVNALLLRPLPVKDPQELVVLAVRHEGNQDPHPISYADFEDYRKNNDAFRDLAGYWINFVGLSAEGRAERVTVCYVTPNYFEFLGVNAAIGRGIRPDEGWKPGTEPVMVLGHRYWQKRFGGDPGVVGKSVNANGRAVTIVGVTPEWFHGTYALVDFDVYMPLGMAVLDKSDEPALIKRDEHRLHTLGRLKPGVTLKQAQASVEVIARQLEVQYPDTNKTVTIHVFPENLARPEPNAATQNPLVAGIFLTLTMLVLLVACVNVANLQLVRATLRQKEITIRAALGAGQMRLVRQLLTESVLLALVGALAGAAVGAGGSRLLASIPLPGDLPFRFDFSLDWRVFGYVAAIALAAGIAVGLVPAVRAARTNLSEALHEGGRAVGAAGRHRVRNLLVASQMAGTMVLLVAAGLFVRSLGNAQKADLGFDPRHVLNFTMDPAQQGYDEARTRTFFRELERRARALPGVESASLAHTVRMGYNNVAEYVNYEGQPLAPGERRPIAGYNIVGLDYLRTMRISIVRGRDFTSADTAETRPVAVINEFMAQKFWPGQDPIGRRFSMSGPQGPYIEVVGVTKNGKYQWIFEDPGMHYYLPLEQSYRSLRVLHVRTAAPSPTLSATVLQTIRELDAELPVYDVMTMEQSLGGPNGFFMIRMGALFAAALGMLGLALAVVGVYGVVSYATTQRTHEIGLRMALGAHPGNILRMILTQGLRLVLLGVGAGLLLSVGLGQLVRNLLFGVSPNDPLTFGGVALLLGAVALVACWMPARRAARVDPMVALRYE